MGVLRGVVAGGAIALLLAGCDSSTPPPSPPAKPTPPKKAPERDPSNKIPVGPPREVLQEVPRGVIAGRIVDDDEKPVEGLTVTLLRGKSAKDRVEVAKTKTGENGSFEFKEIADEWYVMDIEERKPDAEAVTHALKGIPEELKETALGTFRARVAPFGRFWLHGERGINLGDLAFRKMGAIVKVTVKSDKNAVDGKRVYSWHPPGPIVIPERLTDATGVVYLYFPQATRGFWSFIVVQSLPSLSVDQIQLYEPTSFWTQTEMTYDGNFVVTGAVSGQLTDDQKRPIADAMVFLYDDRPSGPPWSRFNSVRTAKNGHYRIEGVPVGRYKLATFGNDVPSLSARIEMKIKPSSQLSAEDVIANMGAPTQCGAIDGELDFSLGGIKILEIARAQRKASGKLPKVEFGAYLVADGRETPWPYVPSAVVPLSDEPMKFSIKGVAPGRYSLLVRVVEKVHDGTPADLGGPGEKVIPLPEMWAPGGLFGMPVRLQGAPVVVRSGETVKALIDSNLTVSDLAGLYGAPVDVVRSRVESMKAELSKENP